MVINNALLQLNEFKKSGDSVGEPLNIKTKYGLSSTQPTH
jgi:hypothetical protein